MFVFPHIYVLVQLFCMIDMTQGETSVITGIVPACAYISVHIDKLHIH